MPLPKDELIMFELLRLLSISPSRTLECAEAYESLARTFPQLTDRELNERYQNSVSLWANRVQWAREHCAERGLIYRPDETPRGAGFWTLTDSGFKFINMFRSVSDLGSMPPETLRAILYFDAND